MYYSVEVNNIQDCEELYSFLYSVQCDGLHHSNLQMIVNDETPIDGANSFKICVHSLKFVYVYVQYAPDPDTICISVKDFKNLLRRVQL